jgi:hypothetical protein
MSSHLFYAITAAENLLVFGSDVCNAFAEAPLPKQGFFIWLDCAFHEWWEWHKGRPLIPPGHVIPVLSSMQGYPKSTETILCTLGLLPTIHKPCLYSGTITSKQIVLKQQVDDFAITAPNQRMANILLCILDDKLTMPIKCQGLLDMFNGINVIQTKYYIKIDCHMYVEKFCKKYLKSCLQATHCR